MKFRHRLKEVTVNRPPAFVGVMDACPTDQMLGIADVWHTLVIVAATDVRDIDAFVGAIERRLPSQIGEWKGRTSKYRYAFAEAFAAEIVLPKNEIHISATSNSEADIERLEIEFVKVLNLGSKHCRLFNGQEDLGTSIGPYELKEYGVFHHKFHRGRDLILLWTASSVYKLIVKMSRYFQSSVYCHLYSDLQALDRASDAWGVKTITGMLASRTKNRITLRCAHRKKSAPIDAAHRGGFLVDNIAGMLDGLIREEKDISPENPHHYRRILSPMLQLPDRKTYFAWENWDDK